MAELEKCSSYLVARSAQHLSQDSAVGWSKVHVEAGNVDQATQRSSHDEYSQALDAQVQSKIISTQKCEATYFIPECRSLEIFIKVKKEIVFAKRCYFSKGSCAGLF